jgi:K(+)-stimulated pyrophosphate-energized sodium pump
MQLPPEAAYALIAGGLGVVFAVLTARKVLAKDRGNERMKEIQDNIALGAMAFLRREFRTLSIFVLGVAIVLTVALKSPDPQTAIAGLGWKTALAFVVGALCSSLCGFAGMKIATAANARTTQAATRSFNEALGVAFPGGVVMGMLVMSVGVLGLTGLFYLFTGLSGDGGVVDASVIMAGFSMGASSIALFARVGGGIYTKAADVGADLVGKVEAGIPEDDPRNPAVIADNVGDNVGDVAGMGADLFESFVGALLGAVILGLDAFTGDAARAAVGFVFAAVSAGVVASIAGVFVVRVREGGNPQAALRRGTIVSALLFCVLVLVVAETIFGDVQGVHALKWALATIVGLACGMGIGFTAEYFTSGRTVEDLAEQSDNHATNIIGGIALGFRSAVLPMIIICVAVIAGYMLGGGGTPGMFGITLAAVGMLGTLGITVGVDAYGPIADNAGGIAEMAHLPPEVRERTDSLDAAGNTTAAIAKGFAIGSAALTALALFVAYKGAMVQALAGIDGMSFSLDVMQPVVLAGLFIGGVVPFLFTADTLNAVGRAAQAVIKEVQRQFREVPGLKEGKEGAVADYARCVDITTRGALREMIRPGLLAVIIPILVGCLLGPNALGGLLAGALIAGVPLAIMLANAGGAWDNAKKYIEKTGGKGTPRHKAAVAGDTVGDPFKDTSGPSINILLKLMAVISLVLTPLLVKVFEHMPWWRHLMP